MDLTIEELSSGARLVRGPQVAPDTPEGTEIFAALFGIGDAGGLGTFPHSVDENATMPSHAHTGPVAGCLSDGTMRFGFDGGDAAFHVEVGPGDYLYIPAGLVHSEEVTSAESAVMVVAHLGAFDTIDA